jgi:predicted RND superfamily exporter protein
LVTFGVALVVGVVALAVVVSFLEFDTSFAALLPEDAPELLEVRELQRRAGGTVEMVIAVSGPEERRMVFARRLVDRLRKQRWIHRADVEFPVDFFMDRRLLLMSVKGLKELQEAVDEEIERAKARANPLYVDLEEDTEGDKNKPWAEVDRTERAEMLPKRTYTSPDGKYLFVRVKPLGTSSDMAEGKVQLGRIMTTVAEVDPGKHGVRVRYAGSLVVNQEQHRRMTSDLKRASVIALVLILLLITIHVRRVGAPVILAVPLVLGVTITLAITALTIGKLNLISGFLVSALLGIGVDFEIHLYLRYLEYLGKWGERRGAMGQAMVKTLPACTTAAATTACAFLAMTISDFRGFREFGLIAGMGVLVTLGVTFAMLPPIAVALGRRGKRPRRAPRHAGFSLRLAWIMVIFGAIFLIVSVYFGKRVAWHNDFRQLRGISETVNFSEWVSDLLGGSLSPAAILVEDIEQARKVERYLDKRAKDPACGVKTHISLASLVPADVDKKLPILRQMERSLQGVLKHDLTAQDREKVEKALELTRARPWTVAQIPDVFRRQFLTVNEKDQFVVVWPRSEMYIDDDVIAWGDELNLIRGELRAMGLPVKIMDENRLGARVLKKMWNDTPWVILSGSIAVVVILFIHFRNPLRVVRVAGSLAVAMGWLSGVLYFFGVDFNVFNLAVIPTIIGLGIDNAVHIYHRYLEEGPGSLARVVSTTGSASFLATATTAIGFGAAVTAQHMGIRSLGWLTILGLSCTFLSSTVLYPAVLRVFEGARTPQGVQASSPPAEGTNEGG